MYQTLVKVRSLSKPTLKVELVEAEVVSNGNGAKNDKSTWIPLERPAETCLIEDVEEVEAEVVSEVDEVEVASEVVPNQAGSPLRLACDQ